MRDTITVFLIFFVVILVLTTPIALIWALNTLFGLGIAYTMKTWAAALILGGAVKSSTNIKKD